MYSVSKIDKALKRLKKILPLEERLKNSSQPIKEIHQQIFHSFLTRGRILSRQELLQYANNQNDIISLLKKNELIIFSEKDEPFAAYPFIMEDRGYKVLVNNHQLDASCALDALAISPMFKVDTQIITQCRITGNPVNIHQSGKTIDNPEEVASLYLGINWKAENKDLSCAQSLCKDIVFLKDKKTTQQWLAIDPINRECFTLQEAIEFSYQFFIPLTDNQNFL